MTDDDDLDEQYETFQSIADKSTPEQAVQRMRRLRVPDDVIEQIRRRHEAEVIKIREMREPNVVYQFGRLTWYTGPQTGDRFWPALKASLARGDRPWEDDAIDSLDKASSKVVGLLDHPAVDSFRTMGLVLGYVQSGKTANFTAVMAKAADRGYRIFIVLSGIHNGLRRQTQSRLARELVQANPAQWHEVTTIDSDFKGTGGAAAYFAAVDQQVLLVVKKNAKVLRKLNAWLATASDYLKTCPALVIDDEADQATVGGKVINPLLAELLGSFGKVAYVGYTATPFANLLINPSEEEGFYPRDFIVSLPEPKGYQGPAVLFGRDPLDGEDPGDVPGGYDMIRLIPDEQIEQVRPMDRAGAATFAPSMAPSLREAVLYFWLATAARRVRATGVPHSTMLVHTTLQTWIHEGFRRPLDQLRREVLDALGADDRDTTEELRAIWEAETQRVEAGSLGEQTVAFEDLLEHLKPVVSQSRVVVDNFKSRDRLDYESGSVVAIAVGGNTLSRGLTLEGLVASYFVRAASAYDTLLQMGRWFGHRAGYADLPRIWLTDELVTWFRHLAVVEAEIRKDIDRYITEDKNPLTFAVRIRTHPKMLVTAPARMKDAVPAAAAYGGDLVESRYFRTAEDDSVAWHQRNESAATQLIRTAQQHSRPVDVAMEGRFVWADVSHVDVIKFIEQYRFHELSEEARPDLLKAYIQKRVRSGALVAWDVAVIGSSKKDADQWKLPDGTAVGLNNRSRLGDSVPSFPADIKTLSAPRDTGVNLHIPAGVDAKKRSELDAIRRVQRPEVGLLLLYPIDPLSPPPSGSKQGRSALAAPSELDVVIGAALVFPTPATTDSEVEHSYIAADLSKIVHHSSDYMEEEDLAILEEDDEEDAT